MPATQDVPNNQPTVEAYARKIRPVARFASLKVTDAQLDTLRGISTHVLAKGRAQQGAVAMDRSPTPGTLAVFTGGDVEAKRMAAEAVANDLQFPLYNVNLEQIVSKYIGETEKNLSALLSTTQRGSAVLLFDEADALFCKRTEVHDSHDRYAGASAVVADHLKQYPGLVLVFASQSSDCDPVLLRQVRFSVDFPTAD